jgi:type VI secretion system protein ImpH
VAAEKRKSNTYIAKLLFEEYYRVSFFRAVQLLETLYPGKKPLGEALSPSEEAVRFSVKPDLGFPASDISSLVQNENDGPLQMQVTFMGMIGPSGVLPHWYTTLVMERSLAKDHTLSSFFDLFHHRVISLFYLAWKKNNFIAHYRNDALDRYSGYFLSLMGLGTRGLADNVGFPLSSLVFNSGLLSRQVPSAGTIQAAVEYCLGIKATVEQFIDRVIVIEARERTRLGSANSSLGVDAVCGSYAWESQTKFRLCLEPVCFRNFLKLLPSGSMLKPLFSLVRYIVGVEYEFEIRPYLRHDEVPACVIGKSDPSAPRLGWSTWLTPPKGILPADPHVTFDEAAIMAGTG